MSIGLPNLEGSKCVYFTVCGKVETRDPKILKWLKEGNEFVTRIKLGSQTYLLKIVSGKSFETHLHIDLILIDFYGKKGAPKQTHTLRQVQEQIDAIVGSTCKVRVEGTFVVSIGDLPNLLQNYIQIAGTPTEVSGVKIRTTGGNLSVEGAPVHTIRWGLLEDNGVMIELYSSQTVTVSDTYLEEAWQSISQTFSGLIQGEARRVKVKK